MSLQFLVHFFSTPKVAEERDEFTSVVLHNLRGGDMARGNGRKI